MNKKSEMNYDFYVITYTPDLLEEGNTAHNFMFDGYDFCNEEKIVYVGFSNVGKSIGTCKTAVFAVGEIVICDKVNGREVCYPGRKPSKWDVSYDVYDDLDKAVEAAGKLV